MEGHVHILRPHKEEPAQYPNDIPCCPICGAKAYISKDVVDGFYFGWSVGCPRFCRNDGIHGFDFDSPEDYFPALHYLDSREECVEAWNERVAKIKKKKGA